MDPGDARRVPEARPGEQPADPRHDALRRAIAKAIAKIERRATAVEGDLAEGERAAAASERARLFVAEAARAPRGATRLVVDDWSTGTAQKIEMAVDPAKGAKDQVEAVFRRARRMKDGRAVAQARLAQATKALGTLRAIATALATLGAELDLAALEAQATAAAPRDFKLSAAGAAAPARRRAAQEPAPPFRSFTSADGAPILVGRGAAHNDTLTFRVARPRDLWLHAKGRPGAHVVVRLAKGRTCTSEALVDAAHLAAHF